MLNLSKIIFQTISPNRLCLFHLPTLILIKITSFLSLNHPELTNTDTKQKHDNYQQVLGIFFLHLLYILKYSSLNNTVNSFPLLTTINLSTKKNITLNPSKKHSSTLMSANLLLGHILHTPFDYSPSWQQKHSKHHTSLFQTC